MYINIIIVWDTDVLFYMNGITGRSEYSSAKLFNLVMLEFLH